MMTSINPKNVNLNNMRQNEADSAPNQINSLFQRNNYAIEKGGLLNKEVVNNNLYKNIKIQQSTINNKYNIINKKYRENSKFKKIKFILPKN